jgi:hypothetical protein
MDLERIRGQMRLENDDIYPTPRVSLDSTTEGRKTSAVILCDCAVIPD